jgi:hypothetical protein
MVIEGVDNAATMMFSRELLVAALHARGICYLAPSPTGDEPVLSDAELMLGLAASKDGRVRFALAGLLLVHPELAGLAAHLIDTCDTTGISQPVPPKAWDELRKQYVAAACLQRMWRTRLAFYFGEQPEIPDRFTESLNLPKAGVMHGEMGLRMLTERSPYNDWSSYEQVIDMICEQPCRTVILNDE